MRISLQVEGVGDEDLAKGQHLGLAQRKRRPVLADHINYGP
jgi:hypothetical protein